MIEKLKDFKAAIDAQIENIKKSNITEEELADFYKYATTELPVKVLEAFGTKIKVAEDYIPIRVNMDGNPVEKKFKNKKLFPYLGVSATGFHVGEGLQYVQLNDALQITGTPLVTANKDNYKTQLVPLTEEGVQKHIAHLQNMVQEEQNKWKILNRTLLSTTKPTTLENL